MIAEDGASRNVETRFWPYGGGLGIQPAVDTQIGPDFSLPGRTSLFVISEVAPSFRLDPGVIDAIHQSAMENHIYRGASMGP